jgi:hypothetical protein
MTGIRTRGKSRSTLILEKTIHDIVDERAPITVRGVAYALFVRGLIESMAKNETQRVSRVMTDMRERGDLDWTLVVDGSRPVERANRWINPDQIIAATVRQYRRDYWQDQPTLIEVWSEKSTVHGILQPILDEFGVTFRVIRGFGSFTSLRAASADSEDIPADRYAVVLYIGDYDPSGLYMSEVDIPRRLERYGARWRFLRIAVLSDDTPGLPSFEAATKRSDPRFDWFVKGYGAECWELDAIDPNDLRNRVREQIETRLDLAAWEHSKMVEEAEVDSMREFHATWQNIMGKRS